MALSEFTRKMIEKELGDYCNQRVPAHARSQVRVGYKIRGNSVTLFEERPTFTDPKKWVNIVVAQFRFNPKTKKWTLYCADRNSVWHEYSELEATEDFDILLKEVDNDSTGIFWG